MYRIEKYTQKNRLNHASSVSHARRQESVPTVIQFIILTSLYLIQSINHAHEIHTQFIFSSRTFHTTSNTQLFRRRLIVYPDPTAPYRVITWSRTIARVTSTCHCSYLLFPQSVSSVHHNRSAQQAYPYVNGANTITPSRWLW